jgi:hypothetical protein
VADDGKIAYFPYLIARGSGELAAAWFSGLDQELVVNVALIRAPSFDDATSAGAAPTVTRAASFQADILIETDGVITRDTAGEYVPLVFLDDGGLGVVTALRHVRTDPEIRYVPVGDRQGFTWRRFDGR